MAGRAPLVLAILDGWGYREDTAHNAIAAASTPTWDRLWSDCPHTLIDGSGVAVGLPAGQMGNSEVGHMNLGAGRVIHQSLTRINDAIADGSFAKNATLCQALETAKQTGKTVHVLGLLSQGGVHSDEQQIHALLKLAANKGVQDIALHAFLDGRDSAPKCAGESLARTESLLQTLGVGHIASLIGRFYAMDRDTRWDRTQIAYDLLTAGIAPFHDTSSTEALNAAYERGETDEFVQGTLIHAPDAAATTIGEGDVVIFMNFRSDRARQLSRAFTHKKFEGFERTQHPILSHFLTLTEYAKDIPSEIIFPPQQYKNVLSEVLAHENLKQLRIAETEKYAHVTFFFNGGREAPFAGETRRLIASPNVKTYDLQPQMSAPEVTAEIVNAINEGTVDVIICNYANPDMVGHTGNYDATVKAIECIDVCLAEITEALAAVAGELLITADHGNAELMHDAAKNQAHTAHTSHLVPFVYVGPRTVKVNHDHGTLADVAPTMLHLLGITQPDEMTGQTLLQLDTE